MDNASNPALVLVADSSDEFFNDLQDALATADYAFVHARNGEEAMALRELLKSDIEFALVDLDLTAPSGMDLIESFNQHGLKPRKIIATSSIFPHSLLQNVKDRGVDAVVQKPITPQAWLRLLNDLCLCPEPRPALSRIACRQTAPIPLPRPKPPSRFLFSVLAAMWIVALFALAGFR